MNWGIILKSLPFILSIIITLLIVLLSKSLPPKLPLFYSLAWGEKQLVTHQQLLIIPSLMTLVALCHLIISWQLHTSQALFKKILQFCALLVNLILTIAFVKTVLIFI